MSLKPLVIVNGLGAPRIGAQLYGFYFRKSGYRVYTVPQDLMNTGDIRKSAERVDRVVDRALERTGAERASLVGISLGGLIGYYYVACGGGAGKIDTMISLGGPLNGSRTAIVSYLPPLSLIKGLTQTRPGSDIIREIKAAPSPENIRLISVGTTGDVITPPGSRKAPGFEIIDTPHGFFPVGHWCLYACPGNLKTVLELLPAVA